MCPTIYPAIQSPAVFIADAHYIPQDSVLESAITQASDLHAFARSYNTHTLESIHIDSAYQIDSTLESTLESHMREMRYEGDLLELLLSLLAHPPKQIFFMGDIAHMFVPHITHKAHAAFIALINALSQVAEVWYFEGNHDFGIDSRIFPRVKIYPRSLQPAVLSYGTNTGTKTLFLSHGDVFVGRLYACYITTLSASLTLSVLKLCNALTLGYLYAYIERRVNTKRIRSLCLSGEKFSAFVQARSRQYRNYMPKIASRYGLESSLDSSVDMANIGIIEGHFHIGKAEKNFIALPSFYCDKRIIVL